jgi:sodium/pantothenate symporter
MPQLLIRFYSIKDVKVLKLGTVLATIGGCVALLPYFNGAIARILHPGLKDVDLAIPWLVNNTLPPIGRGIFLAGVLAAGMSTFASVLIIISSSIVKDLYQSSFKGKGDILKYGKVMSAIVAVIAVIVAFRPPALILVLCAFSWAVIASTCLWPIVLGIYWKGSTKLGCCLSMIGGAATALIWLALGNPFDVHGFIPGIAASLCIFLIISSLTEKFSKEHISRIWGD